jgi:hypothetical protein
MHVAGYRAHSEDQLIIWAAAEANRLRRQAAEADGARSAASAPAEPAQGEIVVDWQLRAQPPAARLPGG